MRIVNDKDLQQISRNLDQILDLVECAGNIKAANRAGIHLYVGDIQEIIDQLLATPAVTRGVRYRARKKHPTTTG